MAGNNKGLKLCAWNCNGIKTRSMEFFNLLKKEDIDIAFLSETHLNPSKKLILQNYTTYRFDRVTHRGGGTALLVKNTLTQDQVDVTTHSIETCAAKIKNTTLGDIYLYAAYKPPRNTANNNLALDTNDLDMIYNPFHSFILFGDMNSKHTAWKCSENNDDGIILQKYAMDNNLEVLAPTESTHPHSGNSISCIIDIALTNISCVKDIEVRHELSSDHLPVIIQLSNVNFIPQTILLKNVNWEFYFNQLETKLKGIPKPTNSNEIDNTVQIFTDILNDAVRDSSSIAHEAKFFHEFPRSLKTKISYRNYLRKDYQRSGNPETKQKFILLRKEVSKLISEFCRNIWNKFLASMELGSNNYWKLVKALSKRKNIIKPIHTNNGVMFSKIEKANAIALSLNDQYKENPASKNFFTNKSHQEQLIAIENSILHSTDNEFIHTSPREIANIISNLKSKCSPGHDGITNKMLKNMPIIGHVCLANILNACLLLQYFPTSWKLSIITPIPKPGRDLHLAINYRPISLLSALGKLYERILFNRITKLDKINHYTPDIQYGFKSKTSATHQLIRVEEIILEGFNNDLFTVAMFLDVEKAFDKVWIGGLIIKLHDLNLPNYLFKSLLSYISNRNFKVKVEDSFSDTYIMEAGVVQGSVLAPWLFSIYLKDTPQDPNCFLAQFADDTAIMCRSQYIPHALIMLQKAIDRITWHFNTWRIKINAEKSNAILFNYQHRSIIPDNHLYVNGIEIPWSKSVKYLGVILDQKLTFKEHFLAKRQAAMKVYFALQPLLHSRSKLPIRGKINIFKTVIRPIFTYATPVWAFLLPEKMTQIQIAQNFILRKIVGARWFQTNRALHRDLNIETVFMFATLTALKF